MLARLQAGVLGAGAAAAAVSIAALVLLASPLPGRAARDLRPQAT
jgi:hypothetical protein